MNANAVKHEFSDHGILLEVYEKWRKEYEINQAQLHGSIVMLPAGGIVAACHGGGIPGDGGGGGRSPSVYV
jgi:hypothetical protein